MQNRHLGTCKIDWLDRPQLAGPSQTPEAPRGVRGDVKVGFEDWLDRPQLAGPRQTPEAPRGVRRDVKVGFRQRSTEDFHSNFIHCSMKPLSVRKQRLS